MPTKRPSKARPTRRAAAKRAQPRPAISPRDHTEAAHQLLFQRQMLLDALAQVDDGLKKLGVDASASRMLQTTTKARSPGTAEPASAAMVKAAVEPGRYPIELRSSLVGGIARHLGALVDGRDCPGVKKKFNLQFGPELFPVPAGRLVSFPTWTSPDLEARTSASPDQCRALFDLHSRRYRTPYLLVGPNSNSALRDTLHDCGIELPALSTPLAFFWGLTTEPGPDENGR